MLRPPASQSTCPPLIHKKIHRRRALSAGRHFCAALCWNRSDYRTFLALLVARYRTKRPVFLPGDIDTLADLQCGLLAFTLRFAGCPSCDQVKAEVDAVWARCQGNRPGGASMSPQDLRLVFESTLNRCLAILEATANAAAGDEGRINNE